MKKSNLVQLLDKLETEGPNRELDARLYATFKLNGFDELDVKDRQGWIMQPIASGGSATNSPPVTIDIDAAATLVDPGWNWHVGKENCAKIITEMVEDLRQVPFVTSHNPASALIKAMLMKEIERATDD